MKNKKVLTIFLLVLALLLLCGGYQLVAGRMVTKVKKVDTQTGNTETLRLTYDENGNLLKVKRSAGTETVYTYDESGNMLSLEERTLSGTLITKWIYTYNAEGMPIMEEGVSMSDWNLYIKYRKECTYDENGTLIHRKQYKDGKLWIEQTYDADGNLLVYDTYYGGGYDLHRVYTYDAQGRPLTERTERGGQDLSGRDYTYGEDGLLLFEDSYSYEGAIRHEQHTTYRHDAQGNLLERLWTDYQGNPGGYTYSYDANGNKLSEKFFNSHSSHEQQWTYDSAGNMLSERSIGSNGITEWNWTYDEYGNVITSKFSYGTGENTYRYTYKWAKVTLSREQMERQQGLIDGFVS